MNKHTVANTNPKLQTVSNFNKSGAECVCQLNKALLDFRYEMFRLIYCFCDQAGNCLDNSVNLISICLNAKISVTIIY